ncbi:MAG: hypothetical protein ACXADB_02930 [Candidatus Hermodarchaeia archaeon]
MTMNHKDFLHLRKGRNIVRVISNPFKYLAHNIDGKVVRCDLGYGDQCHHPHMDHNPDYEDSPTYQGQQNRYVVGVISRRDRRTDAKVADIPNSIFKSIQAYSRDEDWGDPKGYDMDIVVDPDGGPCMYTVIARPKSALSAGELRLVQSFFGEYQEQMTEFCRPCHPGEPRDWHLLEGIGTTVCGKCGQNFEYAQPKEGFVCWGCRNGW